MNRNDNATDMGKIRPAQQSIFYYIFPPTLYISRQEEMGGQLAKRSQEIVLGQHLG